MKYETDQEISRWLDAMSKEQLRIWGAPETKHAVDLAGIASASGMKLAQLRAEAGFIGESEESYAELILDRITVNPDFARHRELAAARVVHDLRRS